MWLVLGIFLILVSAFMLVVEIFIPSFGPLSICAIASMIGGLWLFFQQSVVIGWAGVAFAVISTPIVWVVTYKCFPKTRFGKGVTLTGPERDKGDAIPDTPDLKKMLGCVGRVVTPLRPVGMCEFDGKKLECVAETGYIDRDENVKIINVEGTQLTVRICENN
jgi:membrane-bound serine protease (ClpP class)